MAHNKAVLVSVDPITFPMSPELTDRHRVYKESPRMQVGSSALKCAGVCLYAGVPVVFRGGICTLV